MTRLDLYQDYSGGDQQDPTNQSITINNDDVDDTESPASVENVNVFTSDPSHPEDPRCNCTCIHGPPIQGCCNQERCECIDCFCFACNCSAGNALHVDDSPEQASVTMPVRQGVLATLRRAQENPLLARIAEQVYQVARARDMPPRRREDLVYGEDGLPVPIEEQLSQVARAPDNSRRLRRYTDPYREPLEDCDDMCPMDLRQFSWSAGHHADLPHPEITPEPSNTEEPNNIAPGVRFDMLCAAATLLGAVNNFRPSEAALGRARSARRARRAEQQYHRNVADWMQQRGPSYLPDRRPIPVGISTVPPPLSEQSLAELRRVGLYDALEEPRPNSGGEESGYGSAETSPKNARKHRSNKRQRTSYFE